MVFANLHGAKGIAYAGAMRNAGQSALCLVLAVVALALTGSAQNQDAPAPARRNQIRVVTTEVTVPVTVTDNTGDFVLDLQQNDFQISDDGAPQKIDTWELGGDPLAVALLIETSSRLHAMILVIHSMGSIFTGTVMALNGEAAVLTYDSNVEVPQPFTTDHDAVEKAIASTKFEAPEMSLYDGMHKAVQLLAARPTTRRRILLIVGGSQDDNSKATLSEVVRQAERANVSIYVVGPSSSAADLRGVNKGIAPLKLPHVPAITDAGSCVQYSPGGVTVPCVDFVPPALWLLERGTNEVKHHQLEIAAAATGGIGYRAFRDSTLLEALDRIGGELHAQYVLTYRPNAPRSIGFHRIKVTVSRPGVFMRARPGYYATPPVN